MLNVIVPFSRPKFLQNILDNFKRQTYQDKRLVIVENGAAIGSVQGSGPVVLTSGPHQSLAKNEGLEWVRKNGGGWWTTFDDDDYYGPQYLQELSENLDKADVIGKNDRFVKTEGNQLLFVSSGQENSFTRGLQGPTITARSEETVEFKEIRCQITGVPLPEERVFLGDMLDAGAKIYCTSRYNFAQCRNGKDHVWKINSHQISQNALDAGFEVLEIDSFDLDVVNNMKPMNGRPVEAEEPSLEHHGMYQYLKDHLPSLEDFAKQQGWLTKF